MARVPHNHPPTHIRPSTQSRAAQWTRDADAVRQMLVGRHVSALLSRRPIRLSQSPCRTGTGSDDCTGDQVGVVEGTMAQVPVIGQRQQWRNRQTCAPTDEASHDESQRQSDECMRHVCATDAAAAVA